MMVMTLPHMSRAECSLTLKSMVPNGFHILGDNIAACLTHYLDAFNLQIISVYIYQVLLKE